MSAVRPSACVFAGAGTGKTHGLITECLRLLAGVDREEPLAPAGLCLLTFTEKAAAEMRGRLAARVDALAAGRGAEPELEAAFAAMGPCRRSADWRRVQLRLSSATLSTFHAFCAALLRRAPPEAGLPPGFQLLDDEESLELLEDAAERLVLEALEASDAGVEALCTALDLRGFRRNGLVELLVDQLRRVRDHGHSSAGLRSPRRRTSSARWWSRNAGSGNCWRWPPNGRGPSEPTASRFSPPWPTSWWAGARGPPWNARRGWPSCAMHCPGARAATAWAAV
jgi:hypothetical protein